MYELLKTICGFNCKIMDISILENDYLRISVSNQGAELQEVINKKNNKNILWIGNSDFWGRKAPVLFPIVGKLKDNIYYVDGKKYSLPQHGFARDCAFEIKSVSPFSCVFILKSATETKEVYPFDFELEIEYLLQENELVTSYKVRNIDSRNMYFSIGAHPGFSIDPDTFSNYSLHFEKGENLNRFKLENGLLTKDTEHIPLENQELKLNYSLFKEDALVFKNMQSNSISLLNSNGEKEFTFHAKYFPFYGIWTKEHAPFICLEPWHGIADSVNTTQLLSEKEGIIELIPNEVFQCEYSIEIH